RSPWTADSRAISCWSSRSGEWRAGLLRSGEFAGTPRPREGRGAEGRGRADHRPRLGEADHEVVKVAPHLEPTRLFEPAGLHRLEAGRPDQPPDFLAGPAVVGHVEEDRWLRRPG